MLSTSGRDIVFNFLLSEKTSSCRILTSKVRSIGVNKQESKLFSNFGQFETLLIAAKCRARLKGM